MSVLSDVKNWLGVADDDFDTELLIHINAAVSDMRQVGVHVVLEGSVTQATTWGEVIKKNDSFIAAQQYVLVSCRLVFDPPAAGYTLNALERRKDEVLWRLGVEGEGSFNV